MLKIQNLNLTLKGKKVIDDISFSLNEKECLGFIGPSGTGKSSLMSAVCALLKPDSGKIQFYEKSITEYDIYEYRKKVRYVPPKPDFFAGRVEEHFHTVIKYLKLDKTEAMEKVKRFTSELLLDETILTRKTEELSTGEGKRVLLIQNFLIPPDIFFLDEVFTGLDPQLVELSFQLCKSRSKAMVITSHEIDFMKKNMDKMCFYKNGKILEESITGFKDTKNSETLEYLSGGIK